MGYINPEYKVTDDTQYLPQGDFSYKRRGTDLVVISNVDGSNGVTLYDGDDQVVKVLLEGNGTLTADKKAREATLTVKGDKITGGTGVSVEELGDGVKVISQDQDWLAKYVKHDLKVLTSIKAKPNGGILVSDDETDENAKVLELDNEYIINQGEF